MKSKTDFKHFNKLRQPGAQAKFLIGLGVILLGFCILSSTLIYTYQKHTLEEEAFRKANLVMTVVRAARSYVKDILRPKMYEIVGHDKFIIEAMSTSYISRSIMERFNSELPAFEYRRVSINARNPDFEANELEVGMIQYFRSHPEERNWQGIIKVNGERYFMRFSPVYFEESCLHCHGDPQQAPQTIIDMYGATGGFHKKTDELTGVVSVGIPVEAGLQRIKEIALSVFGTVFLAVFILYAIICYFFNRLIIQNLQGLLNIFWGSLNDDEGKRLYEQAQAMDEIEELATAAELMAVHLEESHRKLEDYAENLEQKVEERTLALKKSEELLQAKIKERNQELLTLNTIAELITQSVKLAEILPKVLQQTLKIIPAEGAGIYLLHEKSSQLLLQYQENAPYLASKLNFPADLPKAAGGDIGNFSSSVCAAAFESLKSSLQEGGSLLNVPLCCRDQVLGVMTFTGISYDEINSELKELLYSIGHQVGITLESLQNMTKLLQSKELLQSVFDGITDFVLLLDNNGRIIMANDAFLHHYVLSSDSFLHHPVEELAANSPTPFALFSKVAAVKLKEPVSDEIQLESGEIFDVHFYPVFNEQGNLESVVCYAKDVTQQKQVEHRIQHTEKLIALGQLAAGVAHEINNPLGIILCYTDLLKDDLGKMPQKVEDIKTIEKHARNCQKIVTDLLSFASNQRTTRQLTSINSIIEEVVAMVAHQFKKDNISIALELAPDCPTLNMDADKMKQVIMNLLMNAAQAAVGEGEIIVSTHYRKQTGQIKIIVKDNGQGIPEDMLDKIFDPFFTTKAPGKGTGLGLSLSYGIVREHGGEIFAESEPGKWTEFTILLPA